MREWILAGLLALAGLMFVVGAGLVYVPAGWMVAGLVLAGWSWLVLSEVDESGGRR